MAQKTKQKPVTKRSAGRPAHRAHPKKEHAFDRPTVPIPVTEEDVEVDEEDVEFFNEAEGAGFLSSLDPNAIAKSKKAVQRLQEKPIRPKHDHDDLPSVHSHSDDDSSWGGVEDEIDLSMDSEDEDNMSSDPGPYAPVSISPPRSDSVDSDVELPYEIKGRKRRRSWDEEENEGPSRLPIKLADGQIKRLKNLEGRPVLRPESEESDSDADFDEDEQEEVKPSDVATAARFGRPAPADVVGTGSRPERIANAKEQIARLCQDIMGDPENSLGLLRRLHTFSLASITSPSSPDPVPNDPLIRKLTFLSELAVYKDIIPGYRIRQLTDKEKAEKVSQMVQQQREWEQGLVGVYQSYLRELEAEVKAKNELTEVAVKCLCTLLTELTHFNFRTNIMSVIVSRLSRRSWDTTSQMCRDALTFVFRADFTGQASLEVVRLLNRMIKERKFAVHPDVLTALLSLRLKTELGVRVSDKGRDREEDTEGGKKGKQRAGKEKKEKKDKVHLSKKQRKALKETKDIRKEMADAEAEVDKEERSKTHTETLKLVFVLYFSILKEPKARRLLPAALAGVSSFAHLINLDFFKDLLEVLKGLMRTSDIFEDGAGTEEAASSDGQNIGQLTQACHMKLLCIVTAFELLSGQGEALNIDLAEFVNQLYAVLRPLAFVLSLEDPFAPTSSTQSGNARPTRANRSTADLLFSALTLLFHRRYSTVATNPAWRSAAFAKRLVSASLNWPAKVIIRTLEFVETLLAREAKLDALLSTEDKKADGVYRPELDDPQLCNPFATSLWELTVLATQHPDASVREQALKLARWQRTDA